MERLDDKKLYVRDVIKLLGLKRQSVIVAIKIGRLKAVKDEHDHWTMTMKDVEEWESSKYVRFKTARFNGEPLYAGNRISVQQAAPMLGRSEQNVYYLIYCGKLKSELFGNHTVLFLDDVEAYCRQCLGKELAIG